MKNTIDLPISLILESELSPMELYVYARGKALFYSGKDSFTIRDLGGEGLEQALISTSISKLLELKLFSKKDLKYTVSEAVEKSLKSQLARTAQKAEELKSTDSIDRLARALNQQVTGKLKLPGKVYTFSSSKNRHLFKRIVTSIDTQQSAIEEFAQFVFQKDWSWTREPFPPLTLISSDRTLSEFQWYLQNKVSLLAASDVLDAYDSTFTVKCSREIADLQQAFQIKSSVEEIGETVSKFFSYVSSVSWRKFKEGPPLSLLASDKFLNQFRQILGKGVIVKISTTDYYLVRIFKRLKDMPKDIDFEDSNWQIAEAIFEPLHGLASKNGSLIQLRKLTYTAVSEKHLSRFGSYVVTRGKELTPLAVFWIAFAARKLSSTFYPPSLGDWREALKEWSSPDVDFSFIRFKEK